jgi:LPXTG-motif cell wall-anchored protein
MTLEQDRMSNENITTSLGTSLALLTFIFLKKKKKKERKEKKGLVLCYILAE